MARIGTEYYAVEFPASSGEFIVRKRLTGTPGAATIIAVELERSIPQGASATAAGTGAIDLGPQVVVRPTNVTATIATSATAATEAYNPDQLILLSNGPQGGFTQTAKLATTTPDVNYVIKAVITDA